MIATELLAAAAISLLFGVILAPFVSRLVLAVGVVDKPDGRRKLHGRVVPLAGGPLVVLTTFLALAIWYVLEDTFADCVGKLGVSVPGFMVAVLFMFGIGVIDDRFRIRGRVKLVGQIVAISLAIAAGVRFESITLCGFDIRFGSSFGCALTMIWLLGVVNAVNLLDGIDGMVGGIGLVVAATLAVMAAWVGHPAEAGVAACLAGTLAAFLVFNKPPAKIFLGDSGSMSIGLLLGSLSVVCCLKGPATLMLGPPVTLLLLPLLDTVAAITRRVLTGRSIYMTDRGHLHHRLLQSGLSHKTALILVGVLSSILSLGVLASLRYGHDSLALTAATVVVAFLVLSRLFGVQELGLVRNKLLEVFGRFTSARPNGEVVVIRLQGRAEGWETIWQHLANRSEHFGLHSANVDINAPFFQESYYVKWKNPASQGGEDETIADRWHLELPLKVAGQTIGVVRLIGPVGVANLSMVLGRIHEFVGELAALALKVLVPGIQPAAGYQHTPATATVHHSANQHPARALQPEIVGA